MIWLNLFGRITRGIHLRSVARRMSSIVTPEFKERLAASSGGSVTLQRNDKLKVDVIVLSNEKKKNALSGQMILQMNDIVSKLEKSDLKNTRAILMRGDGNCFCAGGDLTLVQNNIKPPTFPEQFSRIVYDILRRLSNLPCLSIALIDGPAFGGGAELAVSCDLRLVTPSGQISFVHGRMGLTPAFGTVTKLVQLLGPSRALDLLVTGRNLQGKDLVDWGLASGRVIGEEEAFAWIEDNLTSSVRTQMALKSTVLKAVNSSYEESIAFERNVFARQWGGVDHLDALNKFHK